MTSTPASLAGLAAEAIEAALARDATYLGEHHHDERLADPSVEARAAQLRAQLAGTVALIDDLPHRLHGWAPGWTRQIEPGGATVTLVLALPCSRANWR